MNLPIRNRNLLWEDREQREYRAAKARFFRRLVILLAILVVLAIQIYAYNS